MPAQQDIHLSENAPLPSATEIPSETDTVPEAEPLQAEDSDTFSSSGDRYGRKYWRRRILWKFMKKFMRMF